jgi:hypothetical protein
VGKTTNKLFFFELGMARLKSTSDSSSSNSLTSFIYNHLRIIILSTILLTLILYGLILYFIIPQEPQVISLVQNTDMNLFKKVFFGDQLSIHYCYNNESSLDYIPAKLTEAHRLLGTSTSTGTGGGTKQSYQLTILNCSQQLPSGKTIASRFKLNPKWKPMIFTTSPWSKPAQVTPMSLKDPKLLANYILTATAAKPLSAHTNKEFQSACQLNQTDRERGGDSSPSSLCLVIMKGKRYVDQQEQLVTRMVERYFKYRVTLIDSNERRLSFEKPSLSQPVMNPQNFAMKLYMIREGSYYLPMIDSPTWENIQSFVDKAIQVTNQHASLSLSHNFTTVLASGTSGQL